MTNHAATAMTYLEVTEADTYTNDDRRTAIAQVHATLALAEEQRTANLIALMAIEVQAHGASPRWLLNDVEDRLGLTPTTPNQEQ